MAELSYDIYMPGPHEPIGVLHFGKSPELTARDLADGVARIGGIRMANYDQAYLLAANTLFRTAREAGTLDHHGLPIFYLQRHAAELIIKAPLRLALVIQDLRAELGEPRPHFPICDDQRGRIEGKPPHGHSLTRLLVDLEEMSRSMYVGAVPGALVAAVEKIADIEQQSDTWARYAFSNRRVEGKRRLISHLEKEIVLPLASIQALLQSANDGLGTIWPFNGLMMGNLGELWQGLQPADVD